MEKYTTTDNHQSALLEDAEVILIILFLVSRKQRMLGCWWTPGVSLKTFNSNMVLTDFGKEFMRGQICKTTIFCIELIIQFFPVFSKVPKYPTRNEPHSIPVYALHVPFLPYAVCVFELRRKLRICYVPADTVLLECALCGCAAFLK